MLLLIHGSNNYIAKQELKKIQAKHNTQMIFADEVKQIDELIFSSDNLSLFGGEQKITILSNLSKNRKKSLANELADYIERYKKDVNIVLYEQSKFDSRTKLFKIIKKYGQVVEAGVLDEKLLLKWVNDRLLSEKIKTTQYLNQKILERVGIDQIVLNSELDKLILLLQSDKRNTLEENDLLILTENKEFIIWDLLNAMVNRDRKKTLELLDGFYQNDSDFSYLVIMLAKQLKLLFWLKSKLVSEEVMKKEFKVHPFTILSLKRSLNKFELSFIKLLFSKLTNLDFKVKQGKIEPNLGLVLLISSV